MSSGSASVSMCGHAKNATFVIFSSVLGGAKRYVGPPFKLLGGAMAGMSPPPGSASAQASLPWTAQLGRTVNKKYMKITTSLHRSAFYWDCAARHSPIEVLDGSMSCRKGHVPFSEQQDGRPQLACHDIIKQLTSNGHEQNHSKSSVDS